MSLIDWKRVPGMNIWWNGHSREYISVHGNEDSGCWHVERAIPGMNSIAHQVISPYWVSNRPTVGEQAMVYRQEVKNMYNWIASDTGEQDALGFALRYMGGN